MIYIICTLIFICGAYLLYIGNYLYNYTLNPYEEVHLAQEVQSDIKAKQWLDKHGEDVFIKSYDGLKLHASLIENQSDVYVIMVHGYRGDGSSIISPIKKMNTKGYNLLVLDLRGHGESEGDYIGMGWDERLEVIDWIDYLLDKNPHISIVLYGVSMGAATVMNVSGEHLPSQVKAIIEDCGYTNVVDLFKYHIETKLDEDLVFCFASFITQMKAGYSLKDNQPVEQVKKSQTPILFIHGSEDDFVPFFMLDELYNAANCDKQKLVVDGANHARSCSMNKKLYFQTIFDFIEKYK